MFCFQTPGSIKGYPVQKIKASFPCFMWICYCIMWLKFISKNSCYAKKKNHYLCASLINLHQMLGKMPRLLPAKIAWTFPINPLSALNCEFNIVQYSIFQPWKAPYMCKSTPQIPQVAEPFLSFWEIVGLLDVMWMFQICTLFPSYFFTCNSYYCFLGQNDHQHLTHSPFSKMERKRISPNLETMLDILWLWKIPNPRTHPFNLEKSMMCNLMKNTIDSPHLIMITGSRIFIAKQRDCKSTMSHDCIA